MFFKKICGELNLSEKGCYGVGMIFFLNNEDECWEIEVYINKLIEEEG